MKEIFLIIIIKYKVEMKLLISERFLAQNSTNVLLAVSVKSFKFCFHPKRTYLSFMILPPPSLNNFNRLNPARKWNKIIFEGVKHQKS